jgi:hypothetical protein
MTLGKTGGGVGLAENVCYRQLSHLHVDFSRPVQLLLVVLWHLLCFERNGLLAVRRVNND